MKILEGKESCLSENDSIFRAIVNMVSYIKGGIQAKGIYKQDPEANIWAQEE